MNAKPECLLFGSNIKLNGLLGEIVQPKLKDFLEHDMAINDFISPYYLITSANVENGGIEKPLLSLLAINLQLSKEGRDAILDKFLVSLSMLYKGFKLELLEFEDSIVIAIKESDEIKYLIDDDNFIDLCEAVMDMFKIKVEKQDADLDTLNAPPEVIEKIRKGRKAFREKQREKKNNLEFFDMCNELIHINNDYNYDRLLNMTIWQIKNSYTILTVKNAQDNYVNSGSVQWKADNFPDWRKETKIKK